MKILSVIVPCYNSQDYMHVCIDSLLKGGNDLEIILVNDGSTDKTAGIADDYARRYGGRIMVIHQENKGHGGAINAGLTAATGEFVKIVDSDDWVDEAALGEIITCLRGFGADGPPDVVVSNYVYEKAGRRRKAVIRYNKVFPAGRIFTWEETKPFRLGQYMLMHALLYRRSVLAKSGAVLPEHTFYVDNIYAYVPLAHVETLYYLDLDFYRYYIGREGQSVQESTMMKRIDQQIAVNIRMIGAVDLNTVDSGKKRRYLMHYLEIVTAVSSILLIKEGGENSAEKKDALWNTIKEQDSGLYNTLRRRFLGRILHPRTAAGRRMSLLVYRISQRIIGFN